MNQLARLKTILIVASVVAFALKLWLAWTTSGTLDVHTWMRNLEDVRAVGGIGLYHKPYPDYQSMNYLPFMIHYIAALNVVVDVTGWPPHFVVRLPNIVFDLGTLWLVFNSFETTERRTFNDDKSKQDNGFRAFGFKPLFIALSPILILLSGFHGNTDSVMMFFVVLAMYFLQLQKPAWMIGIAFGMAINIKIVPLVFVPIFLLVLRAPRRQFEYSLSALSTCVIGGMPYLAQDAPFILSRVFGYGGQYNNWGLSRLLSLMSPELSLLNAAFESVGKYVLLFVVVALSLWMNRRGAARNRVPIEAQGAVVVAAFLALTPAFGYQYLAWIVPFLPLWNGRASALFTFCASLYLLSVYTFRWRTWSWYTNTPWLINHWKEHIVIFETLTWFSVLVLFYLALKNAARHRAAGAGF